MCFLSVVMDVKSQAWANRLDNTQLTPAISTEEINEFRELINRAREYDKKMNQPNCEMESKRQRLRDLAKQLGVEIEFI